MQRYLHIRIIIPAWNSLHYTQLNILI